jgi:hypothetical protein
MKIKPEHFNKIVESLRPLADQIPAHREAVRESGKFQDLEKRIRWDWAHAAGLTPFFCAEIYDYANDEHIDTALRAAVKLITS